MSSCRLFVCFTSWINHVIVIIIFLFREKNTRSDWFPSVPEGAKLKEAEVDAFVQCLLPLMKMAMFSKVGTADAASTYHNLALIRPEMVLPELLNR